MFRALTETEYDDIWRANFQAHHGRNIVNLGSQIELPGSNGTPKVFHLGEAVSFERYNSNDPPNPRVLEGRIGLLAEMDDVDSQRRQGFAIIIVSVDQVRVNPYRASFSDLRKVTPQQE